jgi:hypothetical protein
MVIFNSYVTVYQRVDAVAFLRLQREIHQHGRVVRTHGLRSLKKD